MTTSQQGEHMTAFVPAEVFPPGEIIRDELEARGWSQVELAEVMGRPVQVINEIIKAKKRITEDTARALEAALGIDAGFWLRTEALYRLHHAEPAPPGIKRRAALRARVPYRQLVLRGWIPDHSNVDDAEKAVQSYLGVSALTEKQPFAMAAKQTVYDEPITATQEVWLLRVRQLAETMAVAPYSESRLAGAVEQMGDLLRSPDDARHVPKLLADAGVRFVVVERLPSLKIDGVCFWLTEIGPVIGMSLRHDRIDNFWFVLRHEIEHVLNGDGKAGPIIDNELDRPDADSPEEIKANAAGREFCVPQTLLKDFMLRKGPLFNDQNIRDFAHSLRRSSGLVAGQLRWTLDDYARFGNHLARIRHVILSTALHDGFGAVLDVGNSD